MHAREHLLGELRHLAGDEQLSLPARAAIALVLRDVGRRTRDGHALPPDDALRTVLLAGREVARGVGATGDVALAAILALAAPATPMTAVG